MVEQKKRSSRARRSREDDGFRLEDTTIDGTLDAWPPEPPRPPRTAADATRLTLIAHPGQVHRLTPVFSDVGRAAKLAQSFRRAHPSRLDPAATGRFDARHFYDPDTRKWLIAARYLPPELDPPSSDTETSGGHPART